MVEIIAITAALAPVFALVALGALFKRIEFPGPDFWPLAERFTYYFLFPTLLVLKIGGSDLPVVGVTDVIIALVLVSLGVGGLVVLLVSVFRIDLPRASSLFQGSVRFNTYVGLAAAAELYGEPGIIWGALFIGLMSPLLNILSVLFFVVGDQKAQFSPKALFLSLAQNPLIVACVVGAVLNLSGIGIPALIVPIMELISQVALPLGLLAVGVAIDLKLLRGGSGLLWGSSVIKLLIYPASFFLAGQFLALPTEAIAVIMIFASLPTAPTAYILARQMGGDAPLMAGIITFQTLLSAITMPVVLFAASVL